MKASHWVRLVVLAFAFMSVAGVMAVVACGPSAPSSQSGSGGATSEEPATVVSASPPQSGGAGSEGEKPMPTPTATPYVAPTTDPAECDQRYDWSDDPQLVTRCPPSGHPAVDYVLRKKYNVHMKNKAARHARGETTGSPVVRVIILTSAVQAVDDVVAFLKSNGARNIYWDKDGDTIAAGSASADMNLDLVPALAEIEGIQTVYEEVGLIYPRDPSSRQVVPRQGVPMLTAVQTSQADQWHRAGFTGSGVEVAVIDDDFRDFRARIVPLLSEPVKFLCYGPSGVASEGQISASTSVQGGDPASSFYACENSSVSLPVPPEGFRPHGTDVAAALLEIAPDVKLYISNAGSSARRSQVSRWLTAVESDNVRSVVDYKVAGNNDFDVKIINNSITALWDGPGDGTSRYDTDDNRSLLNFANDAVEAGVLWVNSAGNSGHRTWFKRSSDFRFENVTNRLKFTSSGKVCNPVFVEDGVDYVFQLRWSGPWMSANMNLDLVLVDSDGNEVDVDGVSGGGRPQSGLVGHYPREVLFIDANALKDDEDEENGDYYCLGVLNKSGGRGPDWIQLQMYGGKGALDFVTDEGSLENPAESANDGMLSVGATDRRGNALKDLSARGPAPEPVPDSFLPSRDALDLVAPGFNIGDPNRFGTSYSSPRVAGLAALVIQALGDRDRYDDPDEIARYMKQFGSTRRTCDHEWGCGFAMLRSLDPPTNLRLESTANACPVGRQETERSVHNVTLVSDPPENGNPDYSVPYFLDLKKVGDHDADSSSLRYGGLHGNRAARLPGGETYVARGYTCLSTFSGELVCGMASAPSNELTVPRAVCQPILVDVHLGDEMLTLWWNHQPDATEYEVQRVDGDGNAVAGSGVKTGDNHLVVSGLTNGELYSFQVLARGPSGTSAWSVTGGVPDAMSPPTVFPIRSLRNETGFDWPRQYDAVFGWEYGSGASYDLRIREVGSETWAVLPSDPVVAGEGPRVVFLTDIRGVAQRVHAGLVGLIPGTEYDFEVRGVDGDTVSPWTETVGFTTLGRRPAEGEGRPPMLAGLGVVVNAVKPFPRVVLGWDAAAEDYLHEIRIMGGGLATWGRLPHQPSGWSSEYSVLYPTDGQAFITGLIPDTEYRFAVRAAEERDSSSDLDYSPWSNVVSLTTLGVRPATAPGAATAPPLKAPAKDLMAVVDGTTVDLSWTVATNPNYVRQVLFRRDFAVNPIQWTEIPVGLNDATYSDTGLTGGIRYRYRVRSYKQMVGGNYGESGHAEAVIP